MNDGDNETYQQIVNLLAEFFGLSKDDVVETVVRTVHRQLAQVKRAQERAERIVSDMVPEHIEELDMMTLAALAIMTLVGDAIADDLDVDVRQFRERIVSPMQVASVAMTVGSDPNFGHLVPPFPDSVVMADEATDVMHTIVILVDLCLCVGFVAGRLPTALTPEKIEGLQLEIKRIYDGFDAGRDYQAGEHGDD